ncbi:collagen alpha-1(I) chain-like [Penaeus monodon]|uniref:collagen alpha-1(I) chain-like n=1 Tax=Penaeus monodon TaxID=6687 RepID=UPI0018A72A67|nr:collagen alpha-1(I) chain-like [Penaeus monodon]
MAERLKRRSGKPQGPGINGGPLKKGGDSFSVAGDTVPGWGGFLGGAGKGGLNRGFGRDDCGPGTPIFGTLCRARSGKILKSKPGHLGPGGGVAGPWSLRFPKAARGPRGAVSPALTPGAPGKGCKDCGRLAQTQSVLRLKGMGAGGKIGQAGEGGPKKPSPPGARAPTFG